MIKEAAPENSGIVDTESGKTIFVSTSARIFFRRAYPGYSRIRNNVMNQYIAKAFATARMVDVFRPKKGKGTTVKGDIGEVREVAGGKFIGIISANHVRIIAVKGSPTGLPGLPQSSVPAPVQMSDGGTPGYRGDVPGSASQTTNKIVPGPVNLSFPAAPAGGSAVQTALQGAT